MRLNEAIQLNEGLSPVLYHATSMNGVKRILTTNIIKLSPWHGREWYYMSFSRNKNNGFIPYLMSLSNREIQEEKFNPRSDVFAVIEFNGLSLSRNYKGTAINAFHDPLADSELDEPVEFHFMEDRLLSRKPELKNARRHIKSIAFITNGREVNPAVMQSLGMSFDVTAYESVRDYMRNHASVMY